MDKNGNLDKYFAHSPHGQQTQFEELCEHLRKVSKKAGQLTEVFGMKNLAEFCGVLHERGLKYF